MKTQQELWNEWDKGCERLKHLNGIIQNDLDRYIEDKYCTLDDITKHLLNFIGKYDTEIKNLNNLKFEIINFLGEKIREYSNRGVMK